MSGFFCIKLSGYGAGGPDLFGDDLTGSCWKHFQVASPSLGPPGSWKHFQEEVLIPKLDDPDGPDVAGSQ